MPEKEKDASLLNEVKTKASKVEEVDINDMPLETLADYVKYNRRARAKNKELRICRYPAKQCPIDLHPKQRVIFNRKDQPRNPLPVFLYNDIIEYKETLIPGKQYDLPLIVIDYLSSKGTAIWEWVDNPDGTRETQKTSMDPRFALRTVFQG